MKKEIILGVLLLALAAACAPATSSRYREGSNVGQEAGMTVQDERRLTEEPFPRSRKSTPRPVTGIFKNTSRISE